MRGKRRRARALRAVRAQRATIRAALNPAPNPASGDPVCQVLPDPTQECYLLFYVLANEEGG
ncbi:MAG: hypothetical protein WBN04_02245, partial [Paracoccaceae bacterium]